ncbi:MAG: AIR synthase [Clostridiaceae bacterium]|nr:AIR synthase [Clostridiaceae bacterium]
MNIGKLSNEELKNLVFSRLPKLSERTLLGASIGADCAFISLGSKTLIASSDPITAGGMLSGTLAVHVSCNDIAAAGVRPIGILIVILVPPHATESDLVQIVDQASASAKKLGVDIVGGHTEVTDSVNAFVVTTTSFGISDDSSPKIIGRALPGDSLIMTKTAAIEGTYIIAHNHYDKIHGIVDDSLISQAKEFIHRISVVEDGFVAASCLDDSLSAPQSYVHLMHDTTEGGILGAAYEMAEFSGIGLSIEQGLIPVHPATSALCKACDVDPLRLIGSGSMLIATSNPARIISSLSDAGISSSRIGTFTDSGYRLFDELNNSIPFLPPQKDHVYKL